MAKDISFNIEARDALKRGVDALANAVKVTGRNEFEVPLVVTSIHNLQNGTL